MADTIERLYKLTVDGAQAARDLNAIAKSAQDADKRFDDAISTVKKFAGALAAGFTVGSVVASIRKNIDAMDELSKSVAKVGVAAEDLQKLRYAADLSGVSAEDLDKSIGKLAVTMTDLETGSTDAHKALRAIGVEAGDSAVQALDKLADQFAKMPDGIDKTALAITIFGKAGKDMIPLLNGGADELKKLTDEAARYGVILSTGTIKGAEAFNDNLTRLETVAQAASVQMTAGLLPALQAISQSFVDSASAGDGFKETGDAIGEVLVFFTGVALKAGATLKALGMIIGAVFAAADNPMQAGTIFSSMIDDINALEAAANEKLAKLVKDFEAAKAAASAPPEKGPSGEDDKATKRLKAAAALEALHKRQREAAELAAKNQKKIDDELARQDKIRAAVAAALVQISKDEQKVLEDRGAQHKRNREETEKATKAQEDFMRSLDPAGAAVEDYFEKLAKVEELYAAGVLGPERYAIALETLRKNLHAAEDSTKKQKDELQILNDGFESFFNNLANGAADVEEVFKRMVQSILAELLKIWARRYIIETIFGVGSGGAPVGPGIRLQSVEPFTSSGTMSQPVLSPMAMATSTASDTIAPMRGLSLGWTGASAQQQPVIDVTINNNAPGVQVDTRSTPGGIEVIVSQVKAALTADVLRGGNDFAHASERAWGLSRGSAAAF